MELARSMLRQATRFGSGTFISRVAGLFRDILMAAVLGSGEHVAAFFMAFRFSNVLRRILGEGAMQSALIPVFEEYRIESEERAARFFRATWIMVSAILLVILLLTEGILGWVNYTWPQHSFSEAFTLTMVMAPGLLFVCWYGIQAALCTCYGHFFTPAVAPAAFNVIWILALIAMQGWAPAEIVTVLSATIVGAYALQWIAVTPVTVGALRQALGRDWWRERFESLAPLKRLIAPLTLGLVGVSAAQLNSMMDAVFARVADPSGPAYLWYAIRLEQVPIGVIGVALSNAALPSLARCLHRGALGEFAELVRTSLVRSGQAMLLFTTLFLAMGYPLLETIFCRGAFCRMATAETTLCLWAYAIGLIPQTWVILLTPIFYAAKDYRTPSVAAVLSLACNALLNACLVYFCGLGAVSIALATGVAAVINLCWLSRRVPGTLNKAVFLPMLRFCPPLMAGALCAVVAGLWLDDPSLSILYGEFPQGASAPLWIKASSLLAQGACFGVGFFLMGGWRQWRNILQPQPLPSPINSI